MSIAGVGGPAIVTNLRVCKHRSVFGSGTRSEGKGEFEVLLLYRSVGVVSASSETQEGKSGAARKGKWSPRGTGMTVFIYTGMRPCYRQGW